MKAIMMTQTLNNLTAHSLSLIFFNYTNQNDDDVLE